MTTVLRLVVAASIAAMVLGGQLGRARAGGDEIAFEVRGRAKGTGDAARAAAVDQAFAAAVERAVAEVTEPAARAGAAQAIRDKIVGRARRFVASFRVLGETDQGGQVEVRVRAVVDRTKLTTELAALGVALGAAATAVAPPVATRPRLVLLLSTTLGPTTTTFGAAATGAGGAASEVLTTELEAHGFALVSAAGREVPVASEAESDTGILPLSDRQAVALGQAVGADVVVVAGVVGKDDGPIRSTRLRGAAAQASIRVLVGAEVVAHGEVEAAGFGASVEAALAGAARESARRLVAATSAELSRRWPASARGSDAVTISVSGHATWAAVSAVIRRLGGAAGVDAVSLRQARPGAVSLGMATSLGAQRVAALLREAHLPSGQLTVRPRGERAVEVQVSGDAPFAAGVLEATPSED